MALVIRDRAKTIYIEGCVAGIQIDLHAVDAHLL